MSPTLPPQSHTASSSLNKVPPGQENFPDRFPPWHMKNFCSRRVITAVLQYSTAVQYCSTVLQYSTTVQYYSTVLQYSTTVQYYSTVLQYSTALQYCITVLQYSTTVQYYSTVLQYSTTVQYYSTVLQYSTTVQYYSTVLQYSTALQYCSPDDTWQPDDRSACSPSSLSWHSACKSPRVLIICLMLNPPNPAKMQ